jgi:hypothetical protein
MFDMCPGSNFSDTHKTGLDLVLNARSLGKDHLYEPSDTGYFVDMADLKWIFKPMDEQHGAFQPYANPAERLHTRDDSYNNDWTPFDFDPASYFSFDTNYPKKIRPYNDFSCDRNEPEIPDMDYYSFSERNIEESQVLDWYASWTAAIQDDWTFKQYGEWGAFAFHFMKTRNFECGIGLESCNQALSLYELQMKHPEAHNRPLVRRIYFVTLMYQQTHSYTRALLVCLFIPIGIFTRY